MLINITNNADAFAILFKFTLYLVNPDVIEPEWSWIWKTFKN